MRSVLAAGLLIALGACGGSRAPLSLPLPDGGVAAGPDAGTPLSGPPVGAAAPSFSGCPVFPADNEWNRDVSADPVDPHSADYLASMAAGSHYLQPDFGGPYGQPVAVVPQGQARVPMSFLYVSQSDPGPYPFPLDVPIQNDPDRHAVVLAQGECALYETYNTVPQGSGFHADSGARFDLVTGAPRPDGWTSATAAGLPILPGLARYDEAVEQGQIRHALAFIEGDTAHAYVAPATHSAGSTSDPWAPPMGLRVRLKAGYDLSGYTGASRVVLEALKKYGMFVTDSAPGAPFWAVAGMLDSRWPVQDLEQLKTVPASAFEVVQLGVVHSGL